MRACFAGNGAKRLWSSEGWLAEGETEMTEIEAKALQNEIERLRDALKRIASGWPKPMQLARETLDRKA